MGGSSTNTYDSAYNNRIATLMEGADKRTKTLFNNYVSGGAMEYDNALAQSGLSLIGSQTELAQAQLDSSLSLLPAQTAVAQAQLGLDLQSATAKTGIMDKFYTALGQNNPELQAAQAGSTMAEAYQGARAGDAMTQKRRGLYRPGQSAGLSYSQARDTAGAMTSARETARKANIQEYATGLSL